MELLEKKTQEFETAMNENIRKSQDTENDNIEKLQEQIAIYENDWIPINKHEEIVNTELDKLEKEYNEQLSENYNKGIKEAEERVQSEIYHMQCEKEKIESYVKQLENLNEQLRAQLARKSFNLRSNII